MVRFAPRWPEKTLEKFNTLARAAGYKQSHFDAKRTRWKFMDDILAFAEKNLDLFRSRP